MAATAFALIRFGNIWQDARSILLILLLQFVAISMSFDEIANIREVKQKTVRHQASALYKKSGLNGRHELAAWFFEDMLM